MHGCSSYLLNESLKSLLKRLTFFVFRFSRLLCGREKLLEAFSLPLDSLVVVLFDPRQRLSSLLAKAVYRIFKWLPAIRPGSKLILGKSINSQIVQVRSFLVSLCSEGGNRPYRVFMPRFTCRVCFSESIVSSV